MVLAAGVGAEVEGSHRQEYYIQKELQYLEKYLLRQALQGKSYLY
ncbi:hypothetical protein GCM10010912_47600 [Paenibacillus albidus]|uniref:Uncharacterized protein n=1 Tax=Paenibacillus albidus TaxID=2041023 RepID=A0A917CTP3_9BACL|nr:hypothetical protein GCM10010912_47600 [Paenibacillus albidus]